MAENDGRVNEVDWSGGGRMMFEELGESEQHICKDNRIDAMAWENLERSGIKMGQRKYGEWVV